MFIKQQDGLENERRNLQKAHEVFNREKKGFEEERNILKVDNERLKRRELNLKQELETKYRQLTEKEAEMELEKENIHNHLKEQMHNMKGEFNKARDTAAQDQRQWDEERRKYEDEISRLRTETSVLKAKNEELHKQRKELMEAQNEQAAAHRESAGSKLNKTIEQVLQLTESCTGLQIQNSKLNEELGILKGDVLNKTREVDRLTNLMTDKDKQIEDLRKQLGDARADKAGLELQKDIYTKERQRLEQKVTQLMEELEKVKAQKDDLKENGIRLEQKLEQAQETIGKLNDHLDEQLQPPPDFNFLNPTTASESTNNTPTDAPPPFGTTQKTELESSFDSLMSQIMKDRERMSKLEKKAEEQAMQNELDAMDPASSPREDGGGEFLEGEE